MQYSCMKINQTEHEAVLDHALANYKDELGHSFKMVGRNTTIAYTKLAGAQLCTEITKSSVAGDVSTFMLGDIAWAITLVKCIRLGHK